MNCRTAHAFAHQDVADEPEAKRRRTDDVFRPSITVPIRTEALSFGDGIRPNNMTHGNVFFKKQTAWHHEWVTDP